MFTKNSGAIFFTSEIAYALLHSIFAPSLFGPNVNRPNSLAKSIIPASNKLSLLTKQISILFSWINFFDISFVIIFVY